MAFSITFYDNIKYHRQDFINRDLDFFGNGVVALADFPLTFPTTANMTATIGQGRAWVDGFRISNDANPVSINFLAADATNSRIDIVQLGHDDVNSAYKLMIKQGVAAATPVEPNADPGFIKLYAINVAANATSISSSNITDRRSLVPLNVSGTQINMAGSAGTSQNNTFASGFTQTFNGSFVSNGSMTLNQGFSSTVAQGTSPFSVTSTTQVNNLNAAFVNGYSFNQSLKTTDSPTFSKVTAGTLVSNVAVGTAPFTVTSTTKVTNLNVDQVDGYDFNQSLKTTDSPSFSAVTATTFTGALSGNASTATKLATARTLSLSSDVTGSTTFDGSANETISVTLASVGTSGTYTKVTTDAKGRVTSGTALGSSDVTGALGFTPSNKAGDTFTGNVTAPQFISNVAVGTAPFTVTSTTKVTNLNADMVDGYNFNQSLQTTDSPTFSTVTAALSGNASTATKLQTARTISLTNDITGSASFDGSANSSITATLASIGTAGTYTKVTTDSKGRVTSGTSLASNDITGPLGFTPANKAGDTFTGNVTAPSFVSNVVQGTAPFTVTSTTKVQNLNVDQVDGFDFNQSLQTTDSPTFVKVTAPTFVSSVANGTAPFTVTSSTKVINLNADMVDGYNFNQSLQTTDSPTFSTVTASLSGNASTASKLQTARTLSLTNDVTGSVNFDGSANSSIAATLASVGTAGTYTKVTTDAKGRVTSGTTLSSSDVTGALGFTPSNKAGDTFTGNITAPSFISNVATGTAPFTVTSTTKVTNLNADMVDGYSFNQGVQTTDSPTFAGLTVGGSSAATQAWVESFGLGSQAKDISSTDLNNLDVTGFYSGSSLTNNPTNNTSDWYTVINTKYSSTYRQQIAIRINDGSMYKRAQESGAWSTWVQIATFNDLTSQNINEIPADSKHATDAPTAFPIGLSTMEVSSLATEYPGAYLGTLLTNYLNGNRASQTFIAKTNGATYIRSADSSLTNGWGAWNYMTNANDFSRSAGNTGYQKLSSGVILQWGEITSTGGSNQIASMPITPPTTIMKAFASTYGSSVYRISVGSKTNTGFYIYTDAPVGTTLFWFAITY